MIYQADLTAFSQKYPQLGLKSNTSMSDLQKEGLGMLVQHIQQLQKLIQPFHYYMVITYRVKQETYQNDKKAFE